MEGTGSTACRPGGTCHPYPQGAAEPTTPLPPSLPCKGPPSPSLAWIRPATPPQGLLFPRLRCTTHSLSSLANCLLSRRSTLVFAACDGWKPLQRSQEVARKIELYVSDSGSGFVSNTAVASRPTETIRQCRSKS